MDEIVATTGLHEIIIPLSNFVAPFITEGRNMKMFKGLVFERYPDLKEICKTSYAKAAYAEFKKHEQRKNHAKEVQAFQTANNHLELEMKSLKKLYLITTETQEHSAFLFDDLSVPKRKELRLFFDLLFLE